MRSIFGATITLAILLGLTGCNGKSCEVSGDDRTGAGCRSDHFFTGIVVPDNIQLSVVDSPNKVFPFEAYNPEITSLAVKISGNNYAEHNKLSHDKFVKLAKDLGDLPNAGAYIHATPVDRIVLNSPIVGISIVGVTTYDKTHSSGSSLEDITSICYLSNDIDFKSFGYKQSTGTEDHTDFHNMLSLRNFAPIDYTAISYGKYIEEGTGFQGGLLMSIEFDKVPDTNPQTVQVTIYLQNGEKLQAVQSLHIVHRK